MVKVYKLLESLNPNFAVFCQNSAHRDFVSARARRVKTASEPIFFHDIPDPHILSLTTVLQAASVTPDPIGRWLLR